MTEIKCVESYHLGWCKGCFGFLDQSPGGRGWGCDSCYHSIFLPYFKTSFEFQHRRCSAGMPYSHWVPLHPICPALLPGQNMRNDPICLLLLMLIKGSIILASHGFGAFLTSQRPEMMVTKLCDRSHKGWGKFCGFCQVHRITIFTTHIYPYTEAKCSNCFFF